MSDVHELLKRYAAKKFAGLAKLRVGSAKPEALFGNLAGLGVDGYIVNVVGVGPTRVLDATICNELVELAKGEAEVRRLEAEAKAFEECGVSRGRGAGRRHPSGRRRSRATFGHARGCGRRRAP